MGLLTAAIAALEGQSRDAAFIRDGVQALLVHLTGSATVHQEPEVVVGAGVCFGVYCVSAHWDICIDSNVFCTFQSALLGTLCGSWV